MLEREGERGREEGRKGRGKEWREEERRREGREEREVGKGGGE